MYFFLQFYKRFIIFVLEPVWTKQNFNVKIITCFLFYTNIFSHKFITLSTHFKNLPQIETKT